MAVSKGIGVIDGLENFRLKHFEIFQLAGTFLDIFSYQFVMINARHLEETR